jgi:hypothetical protein
MYCVENVVVYDHKIKTIELSIDLKILPITSSSYDMIIGLPDINKYSLLRTFTHRFNSETLSAVGPESAAPIRDESPLPAAKLSLASEYDCLPTASIPTEYDNSHWLQLIEESKARMDGTYLAIMYPHGNNMLHFDNEVSIADDPYWSSLGQKKGLGLTDNHLVNVNNVRGSVP